MAYMTHSSGLCRPERDVEDGPFKSSKVDTHTDDRFVEGCLAEDLPALQRPGRGATAQELEDAVKNAVIPRLYARRLVGQDKSRSPDRALAVAVSGAVEQLLRLVLAGRSGDQEALLLELHSQSVPIRTLFEEIVVPVADEIGRAWEDDRMSFAEVTLKVGRFQKAVSAFASVAISLETAHDKPKILLAPVPGEQHTFGVAVLGNLLIAEGFLADFHLEKTAEELCQHAAEIHYSAIGLSCNSDRTLAILPGLITDLRAASRNPALRVMIGGWALHEGDARLNMLGADFVVPDGRSAIEDVVKFFEGER